MSDPKLVGEILASAQDALARGFAILTGEPHDKSPWALYSPHAVNSSTRNPDIASEGVERRARSKLWSRLWTIQHMRSRR